MVLAGHDRGSFVPAATSYITEKRKVLDYIINFTFMVRIFTWSQVAQGEKLVDRLSHSNFLPKFFFFFFEVVHGFLMFMQVVSSE